MTGSKTQPLAEALSVGGSHCKQERHSLLILVTSLDTFEHLIVLGGDFGGIPPSVLDAVSWRVTHRRLLVRVTLGGMRVSVIASSIAYEGLKRC